jgi:hypothetical protein
MLLHEINMNSTESEIEQAIQETNYKNFDERQLLKEYKYCTRWNMKYPRNNTIELALFEIRLLLKLSNVNYKLKLFDEMSPYVGKYYTASFVANQLRL